jgi:hypothetical protein
MSFIVLMEESNEENKNYLYNGTKRKQQGDPEGSDRQWNGCGTV